MCSPSILRRAIAPARLHAPEIKTRRATDRAPRNMRALLALMWLKLFLKRCIFHCNNELSDPVVGTFVGTFVVSFQAWVSATMCLTL